MNGFVAIKTLFKGNYERTIEHLSSLYSDKDALIKAIEEILFTWLKPEEIRGKKVLLKPNWVKHNSVSQDEICLRTNDQFLLAAIEVVLKMSPSYVLIGDAPIQGCIWAIMISSSFVDEIKKLGTKYNIKVEVIDFRRTIFNPSVKIPIHEIRPISEYIIFDIAKKSFLEPITKKDKKLFRVTNYDPNRLAESHSPGVHKYCITRELFKADVVISLPKVKTHQKAGITAALKNIVGLNGDKDFLPHHRLGGTGFGGDCYPGRNILRYWSELVLDFANRHQGKLSYPFSCNLSKLLWNLSFPGNEHNIAAGWYGNDTTWRMVLDLNLIAVYGRADGTLADTPQRNLFCLCDGIIGGQGDGPLNPEPLPLGIISFTNNSMINDQAMAILMNLSIAKIPLLNATCFYNTIKDYNVILNGAIVSLEELRSHSIITKPPKGWISHFKIN
jgi:uncharacterized protein (DUF362 family)